MTWALADEIARPRPDMNIKVAAFTVNEKFIRTEQKLYLDLSIKSSSSQQYIIYKHIFYIYISIRQDQTKLLKFWTGLDMNYLYNNILLVSTDV